jgi:hypothetical protein
MKKSRLALVTVAVVYMPALVEGQPAAPQCQPPLCVSRIDDDAAAPQSGTLRYAILNAPDNAVITFDPTVNGHTITLDSRTTGNQIKLTRNVLIKGPGPDLLTLDGANATRIFFVSGATVDISGITLTHGHARGGDGGPGSGGAGGGGGAAGLGGAIFLNSGILALNNVALIANRSTGGNGGAGGSAFGRGAGGGGGGFGGPSTHGLVGGTSGDLAANTEGAGGVGGTGEPSTEAGGDGDWGAGGGGGGFIVNSLGGRGAPGGGGGFGGGGGGPGAFLDSDGNATPAGGGSGGSGLGGAIFVRSGILTLHDIGFTNNTAIAGFGAAGAPNGVAKGGALFICSAYYCGPGHDGVVVAVGGTSYRSSTAGQAGEDPVCTGRDDSHVCGTVLAAENESKK